MSLSTFKILPATLIVLATAVGCGSTPSSGPDASTRADAGGSASRANAVVMMAPNTARPVADAGRPPMQDRDAGVRTADAGTPYAPPEGPQRIYSRFANRHCFSYWDEPTSADDVRVFLTACIQAGPGAGNQSWELRPVAGRPGAVTIRTVRDGWDDNSGCWSVDTEDQIRASSCTDTLAIWNVRLDPDTSEIQLSMQDRPGQCLTAAEGEWAEVTACANDVGQFFATRPYDQP